MAGAWEEGTHTPVEYLSDIAPARRSTGYYPTLFRQYLQEYFNVVPGWDAWKPLLQRGYLNFSRRRFKF